MLNTAAGIASRSHTLVHFPEITRFVTAQVKERPRKAQDRHISTNEKGPHKAALLNTCIKVRLRT